MKILPLASFLIFFTCSVLGQTLTQTIKGSVTEMETHYPLIGASVIILGDSSSVKGSVTDVEGNFRIEKVPVGRRALKITFVGYEDVVLSNILVSSAKETVINVSMKESATSLQEITVTATRDGEASNEMAAVSARSFTIEETERYAGSRGDPARMASNFAGVQGADDSRNDIVIRGNSPQSVLWRMEGINIPNPNHFNIPGTAGGPVSMINNKTLANSDFYTGAFPAEFGNSVAGVFDLKLRNGNRDKHEWSGQFGFLGTELFGEGPLSKNKKASYLVSYRYSTLAIFSKLGIDIGTSAVPQYQDGAFKFNFPMKNKGSLSVFGLGGRSTIDILISNQKTPERNIYGSNDRDQYFTTKAGLVGMSYKQPINATSYFTASAALSSENIFTNHLLVNRHLDSNNQYVNDSLTNILQYTFTQSKLSGFAL
ncbi:MAG TPA: carboxypeptidase-like regulatory domain-containing protein, partial [Cyclobacteriaceae bacterium]|nr:carboxypeptidase-like regulatory domain-containing protein [Cyclobacteriaceae bacterium]